jgi:hypothetical protein
MKNLIEKSIYLVRGTPDETHSAFLSRVYEACSAICQQEEVRGVRVVLTDCPRPAFSVIPFRKDKIASVSVYAGVPFLPGSITELAGYAGGFVVEEAMPVAYDKTWPDGVQTPGVNLMTLFHRKPGISQQTFLDRWHNGHTPLSLKIHPLWNYNRNVVMKRKKEGGEWFDGIVEEHFRSKADLLNIFRFFGPPQMVIQRMAAVYSDTRSFLDYGRIETYFCREYVLKSLSGPH